MLNSKKYLKKIKKLIFQYKYPLIFSCIVLVTIFLRFYNYPSRWGLASDQARDVLVVREALKLHTLPIIGPFSASGPFVFGPFWYWVFMIPIGLFPNSLLAPWIFQSMLYVAIVFFAYAIGETMQSKNFGLLLAFLTALSPAENTLSTNLITSALVGFFSVCIMYCFVTYIKQKKIIHLALLSLLIGIAINTHFESIPLICFLPFAFWFGKRNSMHLAVLLAMFFLPFIPLVIFNIQSHGYELQNIFHLHQQVIGQNPLITFIKQAISFLTGVLPRTWATVTGGGIWIGSIIPMVIFLTACFALWKKQLPKLLTIIMTIYILITVFLFFYSGKLFQNFLAFRYIFILIFISWFCFYIFQKNKYIGFTVLSLIILMNSLVNISNISNAKNTAAQTAYFWAAKLNKFYPHQKFSVYTYTVANENVSIPLSLFLDVTNKADDNGVKVGIASFGAPVNYLKIIQGPPGLTVYNLDHAPEEQLKKDEFISVSPKSIYDSVENWYK